jgi:hypothetical protein
MAIKTTYRTQHAQRQTGSPADPTASSVVAGPNVVLRTETEHPSSSDDRPPMRAAAAPARRRPGRPNAGDDDRPHPIVVAVAALAAFAFTASVASLIAILA